MPEGGIIVYVFLGGTCSQCHFAIGEEHDNKIRLNAVVGDDWSQMLAPHVSLLVSKSFFLSC